MTTTSAFIKGASQVFIVDSHRDRLKLAEKIGATPIDDTEGDGVACMLKLTKGQGADCGSECLGTSAATAAVKKCRT